MMTERILGRIGLSANEILQLTEKIRSDGYRDLQSFFHGIGTKVSTPTQTFLYTLVLTEQDFATQKTVEQMALDRWAVSIKSIRRSGIRGENPDQNTILQAGDVLVLVGKQDHFQQAEKYLRLGSKPSRKTNNESDLE